MALYIAGMSVYAVLMLYTIRNFANILYLEGQFKLPPIYTLERLSVTVCYICYHNMFLKEIMIWQFERQKNNSFISLFIEVVSNKCYGNRILPSIL